MSRGAWQVHGMIAFSVDGGLESVLRERRSSINRGDLYCYFSNDNTQCTRLVNEHTINI